MKRALLAITVGALYVLHQDVWFWRAARPLVFGFIPIGLFYHACFTVAASIVFWVLVKHAWPAHLEREVEHGPVSQDYGGHKAEEDQAS
ncbi:MAG TPA: DUF3311 domain-containing protein [Blastocatellia bacterium]|jgi:hypothetical protein|nr:DUF3311 domain-containing protein [Blastocatellia bacterium]